MQVVYIFQNGQSCFRKVKGLNKMNIDIEENMENSRKIMAGFKKNTRKAIFTVTIIVVCCFVIGFMVVDREPTVQELYDEYCIETWAKVDLDKNCLIIDTNPYNETNNGVAYYDAYDAVEKINKRLDAKVTLMDEMIHTSGNDGLSAYVFRDWTITWSYHPNQGLVVKYICA